MAGVTILVKKEDINFYQMGYHFEIDCGNMTINFTKEAMDELISNYNEVIASDEYKERIKLYDHEREV